MIDRISTLRALRHSNFRLYWVGLLVAILVLSQKYLMVKSSTIASSHSILNKSKVQIKSKITNAK